MATQVSFLNNDTAQLAQIKNALLTAQMNHSEADKHHAFLTGKGDFFAGVDNAQHMVNRLKKYVEAYKQAMNEGKGTQSSMEFAYLSWKNAHGGVDLDDYFADDTPPAPDTDSTEEPDTLPPAASEPTRTPQPERETAKPEVAEAAGSIDWKRLTRDFPPKEIQERPGTNGQQFKYITAQSLQRRLDECLSPAGWQTRTEVSGHVVTVHLGIFVNGEWLWKSGSSGLPDLSPTATKRVWDKKSNEYIDVPLTDDDRSNFIKSTESDAFKRSGVPWGFARHLYEKD